jgi:hypothetical protein
VSGTYFVLKKKEGEYETKCQHQTYKQKQTRFFSLPQKLNLQGKNKN